MSRFRLVMGVGLPPSARDISLTMLERYRFSRRAQAKNGLNSLTSSKLKSSKFAFPAKESPNCWRSTIPNSAFDVRKETCPFGYLTGKTRLSRTFLEEEVGVLEERKDDNAHKVSLISATGASLEPFSISSSSTISRLNSGTPRTVTKKSFKSS